jgi:dolichol-phosphate mannosyltransferase
MALGPAWLVLPTYNEAENVEAIVRAVLPVLERSRCDGHRVLVVDDGSPDGTGAIADRLAAELDAVEVLHRERPQGLGPAYLAGFARALQGGAGLVLEMDADFSHDPADVERLIAAVADGADVALGSRYVRGGGVSDWSRGRRVISRGGCLYAQAVLGLRVRDLTGGFKCFRREVLEAIDLPTVRSKGYAFQVELTARAVRAGFTVTEVPIVFRDRQLGVSKMSWRIAGEAVVLLPRLRRRRPGDLPRRGARFTSYSEGMSDLLNVSDDSFQAEVLESEQPVLVDFWAPWCGPCRVVAPVLEEIAGERQDLRIVKLNVDENQRTAAQYGVMSIPTMILFKHGQAAKTIVGAYPKKRLEAELEPVLA